MRRGKGAEGVRKGEGEQEKGDKDIEEGTKWGEEGEEGEEGEGKKRENEKKGGRLLPTNVLCCSKRNLNFLVRIKLPR